MSSIDRLVGQVIASGALTKAERARRREEAKQARKTMRRKDREQLKLAAAAEIWDDRPDKARPTPQRRLKGVFSLRDSDDRAGVAVAVDAAGCVIDALAQRGVITERQREAGHGFEDAARGALGSPAGRSCVDFSPVGHDGDSDDEDAAAARKRWDSLRRMISPQDRKECLSVCWEGFRPASIDRLRRGLDATADWMGLAKEGSRT